MRFKLLLIIIVFLLSIPISALAVCGGSAVYDVPTTTWTAYSAQDECVAEAISSASTGDTVVIPSGTTTWFSTIGSINNTLDANSDGWTYDSAVWTYANSRMEKDADGTNALTETSFTPNAGTTYTVSILSGIYSSAGYVTIKLGNTALTGVPSYGSGVTFTNNETTDIITSAISVAEGTKIGFTEVTGVTGINLNTAYYVVNRVLNTFQVALTLGGDPIDLVGNGSGRFFKAVSITVTATDTTGLVITPSSSTSRFFVDDISIKMTPIIIPDNKKLTITGAGVENTIITSATTGNVFFQLSNSGSRISNIRFNNGVIKTYGNNFRIDHCHFDGNDHGIFVWSLVDGRPTGLVDHNTFYNTKVLVQSNVSFDHQKNAWANDLNLGSDKAVYIEDNVFVRDVFGNVVDVSYAGEAVVRYNTITGSYLEIHSMQMTNHRGTRKFECYGNILNRGVTVQNPWPFFMRSGTGTTFFNRVTGVFSVNSIYIGSKRDTTTEYSMTNNTTVYGLCDGDHDWDGNETISWPEYYGDTGTGTHTGSTGESGDPLIDSTKSWNTNKLLYTVIYNLTDGSKCNITANDGTTISCTLAGGTNNYWSNGDQYRISDGHPCRDQIGRGKDDPIWDDSPLQAYAQAPIPAYYWGNKKDSGVLSTIYNSQSVLLKHTKDDRDYYQDSVSFNGTSGIGCGTQATMEAITACTDGVGFWVPAVGQEGICVDLTGYIGDIATYPTRQTIQGTLYKCSSNTWVPYYTPFAYPHYLASGDPPPTPKHTLSVTKVGTGSLLITSDVGAINCGASCSYSYDEDTIVTLSQTPIGDTVFDGWSGACTGTGDCVVTMSEARSVTATSHQGEISEWATIITYNGSGTTNPVSGSHAYSEGGSVSVVATPADNWVFTYWSGTCPVAEPYSTTAEFNQPASDCTLVANFIENPNKYSFVITYPAHGLIYSGTIGAPGDSIYCGNMNFDCSTTFYGDAVPEFTFVPDFGYKLVATGGDFSGITNPQSVNMNNSAKTGFVTFGLMSSLQEFGVGSISNYGVGPTVQWFE